MQKKYLIRTGVFGLFVAAIAVVAGHPWKSQYKTQNRIFIHSNESKQQRVIADSIIDYKRKNMLELGFTYEDIKNLETECKEYFTKYYGFDFTDSIEDENGFVKLSDGSLMIPEKIPEDNDSRVLLD